MNALPKISVIIPVFNGMKTLEGAMNSVLQQTYPDKELIIIDGGSEDGTIEILKKYSERNLTWVSEKDEGIYDAMNKGIDMAKGEWIYFLGADDELTDHTTLENIFGKYSEDKIELLYGNVLIGDDDKPYNGEFDYKKLLEKNISHQAIFFHRNIFEKEGRFNLKFRSHSDWDFNLRIFEDGTIRRKYIDEVVAKFSEGGISRHYDIPFLQESLMPKKMKYLKSNPGMLLDLRYYDEWWRFIRNAKFRSEKDFRDAGYDSALPSVILSMAKWQNSMSESLLTKGVFSKAIMFLNYLFNYYNIRN